jgi:hypothetical protein
MFTVHLKYGVSAVNTIGLTADGPRFGPPGYEVNLEWHEEFANLHSRNGIEKRRPPWDKDR